MSKGDMKRGDLRKGISFCAKKGTVIDTQFLHDKLRMLTRYKGARRYFFGVIPLYFLNVLIK